MKLCPVDNLLSVLPLTSSSNWTPTPSSVSRGLSGGGMSASLTCASHTAQHGSEALVRQCVCVTATPADRCAYVACTQGCLYMPQHLSINAPGPVHEYALPDICAASLDYAAPGMAASPAEVPLCAHFRTRAEHSSPHPWDQDDSLTHPVCDALAQGHNLSILISSQRAQQLLYTLLLVRVLHTRHKQSTQTAQLRSQG